MRKYILFTGGVLLLCSWFACKPEIKETGAKLKYFDLKEFFKADSARLAKLNPTITKTVSHNGDSQTKKLKIASWGQEFDLFTSSDINKPAWKDSYSVKESADSLIYRAKFPELKTRRIVIRKSNGKVVSVYILNNIHNILYNTTETLNYTPGQFYSIEKQQKVKVMGENDYLIKGVF
ncbi:hypothetical protein [Mucilaginibacter psychrotolerans]|uniref:Uncharacterized protein n=1 Tax=Mucilaginibacter psychrotolerans TaxID=1524096 RepID=A0A4Y8RY80_9SPHI|nr:hypothetical protein [Mucilaginibacter psychrotolerans]TFF30365.1 hypothetical protein E2R66_27560 [Mucilaginibacter psychrotolerans]